MVSPLQAIFARAVPDAIWEAELVEAAKSKYFDQDAFLALVRKNPKTYRTELLSAIRDQFKAKYSAILATMTARFSGESELLDNMRGLDESLRKKFTRQGLDLIAGQQDKADLDLVRNTFRSGFVVYSSVELMYLKRFGGWEDVPSIVARMDPLSIMSGLLGGDDADRYQHAASAVYALGGDRIGELLALELPGRLLVPLIQLVSARRFRQIPESQLMQLLRSKDEKVRKASVLKIISALPKKRVREILSTYSSAGQFYYNVIHWLDFGLSVPRQAMVRGAALAASDL